MSENYKMLRRLVRKIHKEISPVLKAKQRALHSTTQHCFTEGASFVMKDHAKYIDAFSYTILREEIPDLIEENGSTIEVARRQTNTIGETWK